MAKRIFGRAPGACARESVADIVNKLTAPALPVRKERRVVRAASRFTSSRFTFDPPLYPHHTPITSLNLTPTAPPPPPPSPAQNKPPPPPTPLPPPPPPP